VVSGQVDLGESYSVAHVGLPFEADLETLDIEVPYAEGTIQSHRVKVNNVTFRLQDTRGGYIGSDQDDIWEAMTVEDINQSSGQNIGAIDLFTGDLRQPLIGEYQQGGRVFYRQSLACNNRSNHTGGSSWWESKISITIKMA